MREIYVSCEISVLIKSCGKDGSDTRRRLAILARWTSITVGGSVIFHMGLEVLSKLLLRSPISVLTL
jgi:hypothetical protein